MIWRALNLLEPLSIYKRVCKVCCMLKWPGSGPVVHLLLQWNMHTQNQTIQLQTLIDQAGSRRMLTKVMEHWIWKWDVFERENKNVKCQCQDIEKVAIFAFKGIFCLWSEMKQRKRSQFKKEIYNLFSIT